MPMNLGLGMGLSRRAAGGSAPAFSPASLFTGTDEGFWAPVTTSRLWQDTARTTPVTAAGQTVASWELTTRTGVIYAEQATAGSRPFYQVDGAGAGYLDFATSRWMQTPTITPAADKSQFFCGTDLRAVGTRIILETSPDLDVNNGAVLAFYQVTTFPATFRWRSKGTIFSEAASPANTPGTTKLRITGLGDISGDSSILRVDGTQQGSNTADQGTGNYLAYAVNIGARSGGTLPFDGRLYGLILRFGANLTAGQISDAEAWIASRLNP